MFKILKAEGNTVYLNIIIIITHRKKTGNEVFCLFLWKGLCFFASIIFHEPLDKSCEMKH